MSSDRTGPIIHVRDNSDTELEALFNIAMNPGTNNTGTIPLRERNLPASFFRPPQPPKQNQMGIGKDGQNQGESPMYHGHINANHMRAHSSVLGHFGVIFLGFSLFWWWRAINHTRLCALLVVSNAKGKRGILT